MSTRPTFGSLLVIVSGILALLLPAAAIASPADEEDKPGRGRRLDKEVVVQASLDEVWHCWTTSEGIASFFSPDSRIELRLGGAYELYMSMKEPDESGKRGSEGCRVLSFVPGEMLSFEWNFPPAVPTLRKSGAKTHVVLRFFDLDGSVRVRFSQLGWQEGDDWKAGYDYFDRAWSWVLQNLKKHFDEKRKAEAKEAAKPGEAAPDEGAASSTDSRKPVQLSVVIDAPPETLWKLFTTKQGIERWLAPKADIELAVNGRIRTVRNPEGSLGDESTVEYAILSYDPGRMISMRCDRVPEAFPFPEAMKRTWTVVFLDKAGEGRTHLTIVSQGYDDSMESQQMRKIFETGNGALLQRLQQMFEKKPSR